METCAKTNPTDMATLKRVPDGPWFSLYESTWRALVLALTQQENVKKGDAVLVIDPDVARRNWKLGQSREYILYALDGKETCPGKEEGKAINFIVDKLDAHRVGI